MNLFDALKQYLSDAAPGGSLNPEVTPQGLLDVAAMASAPVPVVGDVLGLAADAKRLYDNPEERTAMNYGMSALGLLPFIPAGMFIGKNAKTWDALGAAKAQEMANKGVDARQIWKETGTFKGPDGQWRQEIPDDDAVFPLMKKYKRAPFDHVAMHEPLEAAYPDVKNIIVEGSPAGGLSGGEYRANVKFHDYGPRENIVIHNSGESRLGNTSLGLHELQHAIQQREGWAKGGSPMTAVTKDDAMKWAQKAYEKSHNSSGDPLLDELFSGAKSWDSLSDREKLGWIGMGRDDAYLRLAGEAEARATQARMNMNAAQRREVFPLDSYDVPVNQLIFGQ